MTQSGSPQTQAPNPLLARLEVFLGTWEMESPQFPDLRGQVTFAWIEGGAFLGERIGNPHAALPAGPLTAPPSSAQIIGPDDTLGGYTALYYDARGVSRVYQMSLEGREWKLWRAAPGFSQRFTGAFSADGNTIHAAWEKSFDGTTWEHDFDLVYTRIR